MAEVTHRQIRDAIKAVIEGARPDTMVHTFERYASDMNKLKAHYVTENRMFGCHIRRVSTKQTASSVGRWWIVTRWQIRFYLALDDASASELDFDDWLDAVRIAMQSNQTLGGIVSQVGPADSQTTDGLQVDDSGPVMFCGVLSHSAKCTVYTQHSN